MVLVYNASTAKFTATLELTPGATQNLDINGGSFEMASFIRIKRSTGATAPSGLNFGELGLTIAAGTQANKGERLFVGDNSGNP